MFKILGVGLTALAISIGINFSAHDFALASTSIDARSSEHLGSSSVCRVSYSAMDSDQIDRQILMAVSPLQELDNTPVYTSPKPLDICRDVRCTERCKWVRIYISDSNGSRWERVWQCVVWCSEPSEPYDC